MNRFLRHVHIQRYGALKDFDLGPFAPGLNIVYGPNEAGKSSVASFIGGVLFGWEEARGVCNTYRPAAGGRAGSLEFASRETVDDGGLESQVLADGQDAVFLARDEEGSDGVERVAGDIDSATYRTMFWLTSDELRSLHNASNVAARLLAAGSATGTSPSAAHVELEQRIAALTSPKGEDSISALTAELEGMREAIAVEEGRLALVKQQDRERRELVESLAGASARLDEAGARVESLRIAHVRISAIDDKIASCGSELETLRREHAEAAASTELDQAKGLDARLVALDSAAERALRDSIDEMADEQAKAARAVDLAREDSAASTASYEALLEITDDPQLEGRSRSTRRTQAIVSVTLPLVFVVAAVLVFVYGRMTRSLSFTVFGIGLMVLAGLLAAGALAVLLRPDKRLDLLEERRKDAQWVMVQDQKKLQACLATKGAVDGRVNDFLERWGLQAAEGSLRQARALLDDAREARAQASLARQRLSSLAMRITSAEASLAALREERAEVMGGFGLASGSPLDQVDSCIHAAVGQRDALSVSYDDMNQRFGKLEKILEQAMSDHALDSLKYEYQAKRCLLRERKHDLVVLLLARHMIEKSAVAWESRNQPEVYALASRLFATLTDGAWQRVGMTGEGRLVATSTAGGVRDVRHLSLGTCQQLYLALRASMLMLADGVGCDLPVIADDILVHFDAARRAGAARVLAELACKRQVIVFTCHRETVAALQQADPTAAYLEL